MSTITNSIYINDHHYRVWSPWHHLRLLLWLYLYPRRYAAYRAAVGTKRARLAISWLANTLLWTALLLPIAGILIDPALEQMVIDRTQTSAMLNVYNLDFSLILGVGIIVAWVSAQSIHIKRDTLTNLVASVITAVFALLILNTAMADTTDPADADALTTMFNVLLLAASVLAVVFGRLAWQRSPLMSPVLKAVALLSIPVVSVTGYIAIGGLQDRGTLNGAFTPALLPATVAGVMVMRLLCYNYRRLLSVVLLVLLSLIGALVNYWATLAAGSAVPGVLIFAVGAAMLVAADNTNEHTISAYMLGTSMGMLAGVFALDLSSLGEGRRLLLGFFPVNAVPGMLVMTGLWAIARIVRHDMMLGRVTVLNVALLLLVPLSVGVLIWMMVFGGWASIPV